MSSGSGVLGFGFWVLLFLLLLGVVVLCAWVAVVVARVVEGRPRLPVCCQVGRCGPGSASDGSLWRCGCRLIVAVQRVRPRYAGNGTLTPVVAGQRSVVSRSRALAARSSAVGRV